MTAPKNHNHTYTTLLYENNPNLRTQLLNSIYKANK